MKRFISILLSVALLSAPVNAFANKHIEINIPSRTLKLYDSEKFIKQYPIAVGRPSYDSPIGHYNVLSKIVNPTWSPKGQKPVPPGPKNPLGTRWIGFFSEYGVHGNSDPKSIGTFASKGCIRMYNYDVEELYNKVDIGTDVNIYYNTFLTYDNPNKNLSTLIVQPDIYNRKVNTADRINTELKRMGISEDIPKEKLSGLFSELNKKAVVFSKNWAVLINGEYITSDTIVKTQPKQVIADDIVSDTRKEGSLNYDGTNLRPKRSKTDVPLIKKEETRVESERKFENILVNLNDVNLLLGMNLDIDIDGRIKTDKGDIYYELQNGIIYASLKDIAEKVGGTYTFDNKQEFVNWTILYGKIEGRFFKADITTSSHVVYVWIKDILNALELEGTWSDEKKALMVGDKIIQGKMLNEKLYLTPRQINEYFGVDAQFNSFQNRIELTKPKVSQ